MDQGPAEENERINPQAVNQQTIEINLQPDSLYQTEIQSQQQISSQTEKEVTNEKQKKYFINIPIQIQLLLQLIVLGLLISCYFVDAIIVDTYDDSHNIIEKCTIKFYGKKKCEICQSNQRVTSDIYMITLEDYYRDYYSNYFTFNPILQTITIISLIISIYLKSKALYGLIKFDWSLIFSCISIIFNCIVPLYLLKQVNPGSTSIQETSLILNLLALVLQITILILDIKQRNVQNKEIEGKIKVHLNLQLILVMISVVLQFLCYFFEQFIFFQASTQQYQDSKCQISIFSIIYCRNQLELNAYYSSRIKVFECYDKPFCQLIILYPYLIGISILIGLYTIFITFQNIEVKAATLILNLLCSIYIFICITLLLSLNNIDDLEIKNDLKSIEDSNIAPVPAIFQYFACCLLLLSFYLNLRNRINQISQRVPLMK